MRSPLHPPAVRASCAFWSAPASSCACKRPPKRCRFSFFTSWRRCLSAGQALPFNPLSSLRKRRWLSDSGSFSLSHFPRAVSWFWNSYILLISNPLQLFLLETCLPSGFVLSFPYAMHLSSQLLHTSPSWKPFIVFHTSSFRKPFPYSLITRLVLLETQYSKLFRASYFGKPITPSKSVGGQTHCIPRTFLKRFSRPTCRLKV